MAWLTGDPWLGAQDANPSPSNPNWPDPWLGTDGMRDPSFGGAIVALNAEKSTIEVTTWFLQWLKIPGRWEPQRTEGAIPIFIAEEETRWNNFTRKDIITIRTDMENREVVGVLNMFENETDFLTFRVMTRHSRMHCHLLRTELVRQLQIVRNDPFGPSIPGEGRNWLKITDTTRGERQYRGIWYAEVVAEVHRRWRPIVTSR